MTKIKTLSKQQRVFCEQYFETGNAAVAYRRAFAARYLDTQTLARKGGSLLRRQSVQAYIEAVRARVVDNSAFGVVEVLKRLVDIATADPNDLVRAAVRACRYCHGFEHRYSYTAAEYQDLVDEAIANGKDTPSIKGGIFFDPKALPHENCPQCGGDGLQKLVITDSSLLTGKARALYAGVREGRHGLEILMRDQDKALENIAKFLGMFKLTVEHQTQNAEIVVPDEQTDPAVAAKIYKTLILEG